MTDAPPRPDRPRDLATLFEPPARHTRLTRGALARVLVEQALRGVPVAVRYPDGRLVGDVVPGRPVIDLHRPKDLFVRMESHPKIGLGEAYMAGEWDAAVGTDLADALTPFAARLSRILPRPVLALRGVVDRALPHAHRNDVSGSRANVAAHYDLSNELFATFLDPSMTYSSALFADTAQWGAQDLQEAQRRKYDAILDAARVRAGSRLLEIGTGWGGLAVRAAARGAQVTTITLSAEQRSLALRRIAAAGLSDRVEVRLEDYREARGRYDAVVSVEMIEAVGEQYWPDYFRALDTLLVSGGTVALQAIVMDHQRYLTTRNSYGWVQKHIFPGGLIPSLQAIEDVTAAHTTLAVTGVERFGAHYAHTLRRWRQAFTDADAEVAGLGFDETFRRMWRFYLAYSEAGFASGYLDVARVVLERGGRS